MKSENQVFPIPKLTVDAFLAMFSSEEQEKLRDKLFNNDDVSTRLLAWAGPPKLELPLYVISQSGDAAPLGCYNDDVMGPAKGYDRIAFWCERPPRVEPLEIWSAYPDVDLIPIERPLKGEGFTEYFQRTADQGVPVARCGDGVLRFALEETGSDKWTYNDREECVRRIDVAIDDLAKVRVILARQLEEP